MLSAVAEHIGTAPTKPSAATAPRQATATPHQATAPHRAATGHAEPSETRTQPARCSEGDPSATRDRSAPEAPPSFSCTVDGAEYRYFVDAEGGAHVTRCLSSESSVSIPSALDGHPVTHLEPRSFAKQFRLVEVCCPPELQSIGQRAFDECTHLANVQLNEGLRHIDNEAFRFSFSLLNLHIPSTVETLGINLVGIKRVGAVDRMLTLTIAPGNPHLFFHDDGALYRRADEGLVLVDGSLLEGGTLTALPGTVRIGANALASHGTLASAVLPEGVRVIEEGAFRGCTRLRSVRLPESLEEIQCAAFSCTALQSLYLPAACVRVAPHALHLGPVLENASCDAYQSSIQDIRVHPDNPAYCVRDGILCRRLEGDALEAVLCPRGAEAVSISRNIVRVAETAFAGTASIGELRVHDAVEYDNEYGLLPHQSCSRLTIDLSRPVDGFSSVSIEVPSGNAGKTMLKQSLSCKRVDAATVLSHYDATLPTLADRLEQARGMLARLAAPVHLSAQSRRTFTEAITGALESICIHFGARSYWRGFDHMVDAGILHERNITSVIGVLSSFGDTPSVGYLLDVKRHRFGKMSWDYAI